MSKRKYVTSYSLIISIILIVFIITFGIIILIIHKETHLNIKTVYGDEVTIDSDFFWGDITLSIKDYGRITRLDYYEDVEYYSDKVVGLVNDSQYRVYMVYNEHNVIVLYLKKSTFKYQVIKNGINNSDEFDIIKKVLLSDEKILKTYIKYFKTYNADAYNELVKALTSHDIHLLNKYGYKEGGTLTIESILQIIH
ncbi:MAG: hypothetical protein J6I96_00680 [Oscillospiraceae bacterium]|nr:hypothetical protein [Oscillospiraceae bacterium]